MTPSDPWHGQIHVLWSDEDQCWIADAPDLRFCSAHGQTPAEAVGELAIAVAGGLETAHERSIPIPEPRYRPWPASADLPCAWEIARKGLDSIWPRIGGDEQPAVSA